MDLSGSVFHSIEKRLDVPDFLCNDGDLAPDENESQKKK